MNTLEQTIQAIEDKAAADIEAARKRHYQQEPFALVARGYKPPSVTQATALGETWVTFRGERYNSLRKDGEKDPDAALLHTLLSNFRPLETKLWRGGHTMSVGLADSPPPGRDLSQSEDILPVWVSADPNDYAHTFEVHWRTRGRDDELLRIGVSFPLYRLKAATFHGNVRRDQRTGTVVEILGQEWRTVSGVTARRYGSGSTTSFGCAEIMWKPGDDAPVFAVDWVRAILGEEIQ